MNEASTSLRAVRNVKPFESRRSGGHLQSSRSSLALHCPRLAVAARYPPPTSANTETSELVLLVNSRSSVAASIQAKLRQAGYQVVADEASEHDAVVDVSEQSVQDKSLFTVKVNGKQSVSYTTHVTVTLRWDGVTLATDSAEFDSEDGIDPDDLQRIVSTITKPGVMTKLARDVREKKTLAASAAKKKSDEEAASKLAEEQAEKRKADQEDEAAWALVVVAECTTPRETRTAASA